MADSLKNEDGETAKAAAAAASPKNPEKQAGEVPKVLKDKAEVAETKAKETAPAAGTEAATAPVAPSPEKAAAATVPGNSKPVPAQDAAGTAPESAKSAGKAAPTRKTGSQSGSKSEAPAEPKPSIKELKEKIMANTPNYTDNVTATVTDAVAEIQDRSKAAFEKSSELMAEASEFAKGTVEAMVESGKILSGGVQDIGKTYAEEAKSAYELMTADLKDIAAVKSPTDLFQLQGKILRRNFDAVVSTTSKNAEKIMKLSNDVFAPISARVNVAAEKMSKVA